MTSSPKVSVIIPLFNREKYIKETVKSVLNQTYKNIELIIVDDGSTDNSRYILESYQDSMQILEHAGHANKGPAATINIGLKNATGDFISILDSDDLFAPDKLAKQVEYLLKNPTIGTVYANGMNITSEGKPLYTLYPSVEHHIIGPEPVLEHCAFNLPCNALVRKSVFNKAGYFDENLRTAYDHEMAIRIAEIAPVGYLNECLWSYRRHGDTLSHMRTMERWKNGFKILYAARKRYPYSLGTVLRRKAILHFRMGQCYHSQKNILFAFIHFILAGVYNPVRSMKVLLKYEQISSPN